MSQDIEKRRYCCTPSMPGMRVLTFPDGSKTGVVGLEDVLAGVYSEGRQVNAETAEEIVKRLAVKNYIPSSDLARKEYSEVLLKEYGRYCQSWHQGDS
ncbi:MAG: hypothetical protein PHC90_11225 [Syntrophorhabdaceae bacterium]|nr:hypothetical protein [Syntrophorhabdaceae bacterium]